MYLCSMLLSSELYAGPQTNQSMDPCRMRTSRYIRLRAIVLLILLLILLLCAIFWGTRREESPPQPLPYRKELFSLVDNNPFVGFNNETGTKNGEYIVPNFVHFLFLEETYVSYVTAVCILAAHKNQHPEKIFIHGKANQLTGPHWERLKKTEGLNIEVREITLPTKIFGEKLANIWDEGDISRIQILMEHGGIFLENDSYLVRSLDCFRKYEMTVGLSETGFIGTHTLVAHKDARFLKLWLETYRGYDPQLWHYSAGQKPTLEVLRHKPELVHSVKTLFGVEDLSQQLYRQYNWKEWRMYHTIHLLIRHRDSLDSWWNYFWWPELDEKNIHDYPMTFGEMARDVYDPV